MTLTIFLPPPPSLFMICLPIYKWGSMVSYSFKPSKNLNQIRVGCQQPPFPNHKNVFPLEHLLLIHHWAWISHFSKEPHKVNSPSGETNEQLKGISRLNARILLMPGHHGRYLSVHYQGNWGLSLAPDPGLSPRTSREGLSGYRRNVFLPGCRPMKAQAAMTQEGPCLNRKEQTV